MRVVSADFPKKYLKNKEAIDAAISRVLKSGRFILGEECAAFEKEFADYVGAGYCVGVNSGTDALYLSLRALGVSEGDEVITTVHTATPTISAVRMTGATPVFVDVDPRTFNIDTSNIEKKITDKTKVLLPVHLYGYPAEMHPVQQLARKYDLKILEDAAQASGALYKGAHVGVLGDVAAFSFYPTKNLGAFGDGGAVITNDKSIHETIRRLRNYGEESKYHNITEGINSRLDELQAAILRVFLKTLDDENKKRNHFAKLYRERLKDVPVILPPFGDGTSTVTPAWHLFVIQAENRDELKIYLSQRGVQTAIHYPKLPYQQQAYTFLGQRDADYPNASALIKNILSIPLHGEMNADEVDYVADSILTFYNQ